MMTARVHKINIYETSMSLSKRRKQIKYSNVFSSGEVRGRSQGHLTQSQYTILTLHKSVVRDLCALGLHLQKDIDILEEEKLKFAFV